ncbi:MAG: phage portal protein [Sulfurospirillaceae bacterium]|nr:phage portal protein [Sulfurospirillaceae bacterium]
MSLLGDILDIRRGFYEGGKLRGSNNDFYNANAPFEDQASPDRAIMRARARWLHENNGIISGIDNSIKQNAIAGGLKFQSKTGDSALNNLIETLFNEWVKQQNCDITGRLWFGDMQNVILGQRMMDGEILIYPKLTNDKKHPLKIQLIEADRFDGAMFTSANTQDGTTYIDGMEVDNYGKPQKYILKDGLFKTTKLNASEVIHYFKMTNRATQYRGISEYKQIIIDLRNLAGYLSSTIQSQRARASVAYAIETDNVAGRIAGLGSNKGSYDPIYDINGVMVHYLNRGESLKQFDPTIDGAGYKDFIQSCIRLIAVGRQISYELAFRDYSQVNFSSARASLIQDHKRFSTEQAHFARYVLAPIYERWLDANVLAGNIKGISAQAYFSNKKEICQPRWIAPAREWVDPLKDINAFSKEYEMGMATLEEYAAQRGKDLEEILTQRKKEQEMLKNAGIIQEGEKSA